MLIIISSIFVSLAVLLSAFVNFFPNLRGVVEDDFRRRVTSNANLYAMQYGQLGLRAKTIKENDALTFSPRQNCPNGGCAVPVGQAGEYLIKENNVEKNRVYSVISYRKLSGTDPSPTLLVTPTIGVK